LEQRVVPQHTGIGAGSLIYVTQGDGGRPVWLKGCWSGQ
jgi:hypothetical protein